MNILRQEVIDLERVADLLAVGVQRDPPVQRDHGLWHVTNLLEAAHLITKGRNLYPGRIDRPSGIMSLGRIWETAVDCFLQDYAEGLGGLYTPDVMYTDDGVCGSLDGVMVIPALDWMLVCESKLRFTLRDDISLDHFQQVRAYCHLADTNLACYVSGHISTTPPVVQALLRIVRFTPLSIAETWQGILNTKRYLESLGIGPASNNEEKEGSHGN